MSCCCRYLLFLLLSCFSLLARGLGVVTGGMRSAFCLSQIFSQSASPPASNSHYAVGGLARPCGLRGGGGAAIMGTSQRAGQLDD